MPDGNRQPRRRDRRMPTPASAGAPVAEVGSTGRPEGERPEGAEDSAGEGAVRWTLGVAMVAATYFLLACLLYWPVGPLDTRHIVNAFDATRPAR